MSENAAGVERPLSDVVSWLEGKQSFNLTNIRKVNNQMTHTHIYIYRYNIITYVMYKQYGFNSISIKYKLLLWIIMDCYLA